MNCESFHLRVDCHTERYILEMAGIPTVPGTRDSLYYNEDFYSCSKKEYSFKAILSAK